MIILNTKHFGKLEVEDDMIINFDLGIPGFLEEKKFVILSEKEHNMFCWLQSITNGELALVLIDILCIIKDYKCIIEEEEEEIKTLGNKEDFLIFAIATIAKDIKNSTINLKAPIIVNKKTKKAKQIIINNRKYPLRYKFIDHIKKI